jgi:hypothetical protein
MFGNKKVSIDMALWERLEKLAELAGYASTDEFVIHALEKEVANIEEGGETDEAIREKLKGLGYIS